MFREINESYCRTFNETWFGKETRSTMKALAKSLKRKAKPKAKTAAKS